MSRIFFAIATALVFSVPSASQAATNLGGSLTSSTILAIDGVPCDRLLSWEGGDLRGGAVTQGTKSASGPSVAPLVIQVGFPASSQLTGLINEMCSGQTAPHTLTLIDYDSGGLAAAALQLGGAVLMEVVFPAFIATTTPVGPVKLVFAADKSGAVAPSSITLGSTPGSSSATTFQLAVDGLDGRGVQRIEALTISRPSRSDPTPRFSSLQVTLQASTATTWKTWYTDFVVNGNNGGEKHGALTMVDASGRPMETALNFQQLGMLRLSRPPGSHGLATSAEIEMYVGGLMVSKPAGTTPQANTEAPANSTLNGVASDVPLTTATLATPLPTTSSVTGVPVEPVLTTATLATPVPTSSTSVTSVDSRTLVTDVPLKTANPATSPALATVTNPADQGSRDPAEFPRVSGLTRVQYSGTYQKTYTSEQATYTSTDAIYQLVARVDAAAKAAGWSMTTLEEGTFSSGKSVAEGWTKLGGTVSVSYREQPAGGTQFALQVYLQIPEESGAAKF
ncbi:MAG: hypothetical protein ABIZ04_27430 [Opitutus sp.]